ncbi:MAG: glycosyltransferase family 4 protein [Clostridiales bacterium]|nr:glycosyltransferase family 4 protein [Clostridiales bacterium]
MIITVVCDVLGEENNGTTIASMNLIRFLQSRGHTVRILCADQDKEGKENYYIVPNLSLGKLLDAYIRKIGVTIAKPQEDVVRKAIEGADHVHAMLPFGLGMKATKICKELGISITAGFHMQAENFTSYIKLNGIKPLNKGVYKFIYKHFYKHVDGIHYPTDFIRNVFESTVKQKTNGYVISNGVHSYVQKRESEKPKEYKDKIVILTTGRYAREKSQDTLIKAVKLSKHASSIQLILGGQGVKEKHYKKLASSLPVPPLFKFYSRTEIIDVLNYADMYVHPAEMELEGISCLEAIACGKLTIVSSSPRSATRGFAIDNSCIFKNRNAKDLARVIDFWIDNPQKRKFYEQKYLEQSIVYDQNECMKRMEEMITEVYNEKQKAKSNLL